MTTAEEKAAYDQAIWLLQDDYALHTGSTDLRRGYLNGFQRGAAWQREQPVEITDEMARRLIPLLEPDWPYYDYDEMNPEAQAEVRAALEAALNTATTPAADHVHDDFGDCCVARAREKWRAEHPGEEPENVSRLNGKRS